MPAPLVHGLIMTRDEWPLLEVSLTHALLHHVDRVHVLDHASTDGTAAGLARLRREWGERLTLIRLGDCPFLQEAATSLLREVVDAAPDDWLYVFDADELGIAGPSAPLRDVLADVDPRCSLARYEVHNWVAPADFSAADLDRYAELRFRATPPVFLPVPAAILVDEILSGAMNYFDVPFASKVIVRASTAGWITAGSHGVTGGPADAECILPPAAFRVAHLPLLDRRRLDGRVAQGMALLGNGFEAWHGWQSQMLARVAHRDGLDAFWARHSLDPARGTDGVGAPTVVPDDALVAALAPTLARVASLRRDSAEPAGATGDGPAHAAALVPAALRSIRRLQGVAKEALARHHDAARQAAAIHAAAPATRRRRGLGHRLSAWLARPFTRPRPAADGHEPVVVPVNPPCQHSRGTKRPAA